MSGMDACYILNSPVAFADVDRDEVLLLSGVFKLLQEAAIHHANQFHLGTENRLQRQESWLLNRISVGIHRYPRFEEPLRVETWSRGVIGFRGYREYRVYCGAELVIASSSLWVYLNMQTKTLVRVPEELAANFPVVERDVYEPEVDRLAPRGPVSAGAIRSPVTLRYSDVDTNGHVNNTAYLEILQTALSKHAPSARPSAVKMRFLKEILPTAESVDVTLDNAAEETAFSISHGDTTYTQGVVVFAR